MTDRHAGYIVTLEDGVREDDAEVGVLNAIRMVRGVLSVVPVLDGFDVHIAEERARHKLQAKLYAALRGDGAS